MTGSPFTWPVTGEGEEGEAEQEEGAEQEEERPLPRRRRRERVGRQPRGEEEPVVKSLSIRPFSYLRFQSLDFEEKHMNNVLMTSRDHLLIYDSSRLSIKICGIVSWETAVPQGRSRFDSIRFRHGSVLWFRYVFDLRAPNPCWTRCLQPATCLRKRFGFDRFDDILVSPSEPLPFGD